MLLNIGCGAAAHPDWLNLYILPQHSMALVCNMRLGLSLTANQAEARYCSDFPERPKQYEVEAFIAERVRVMSPIGVMRVVGPEQGAIPEFATLAFDVSAADTPQRKLDSQYVEAIRAAA